MTEKDRAGTEKPEDKTSPETDQTALTEDEMSQISGGMGLSIGPTGVPDFLGQDAD